MVHEVLLRVDLSFMKCSFYSIEIAWRLTKEELTSDLLVCFVD